MMYISPYPFAVSVKSSNIFLEKKVFSRSPVVSQIQRLFLRDFLWLFLSFLFITLAESSKLDGPLTGPFTPQPNFTVFQILFEIVSAFGTVGLSIPINSVVSFSASFTVVSKLIICLIMLFGRHRY
jgi:Trk-type K+ transport system membrane component